MLIFQFAQVSIIPVHGSLTSEVNIPFQAVSPLLTDSFFFFFCGPNPNSWDRKSNFYSLDLAHIPPLAQLEGGNRLGKSGEMEVLAII